MVADAAYDALMEFDKHLHLGMLRSLQRINYVNLDAETTAVFIEAFSRSSSRDEDQRRDGRAAAASKDAARGVRRFKLVDRQPAKQAYLHSTRQDDGEVAGGCRPRVLRADWSTAAQPHNDVVRNQSAVERFFATRRAKRQGWSPDTGCETLTVFMFSKLQSFYHSRRHIIIMSI